VLALQTEVPIPEGRVTFSDMLGRVLQVTRFDFAADNPMKIVVPGHFNADLCF